ncbi:hypothetical protein GCM10010170_095200 [Dactylosporangium salmoneum]|uniref:Uncharacterized protein n=1 Tax=Dactylosporangium salmoneum TaxID=53361 RepID=A0ABP5UUB0_9ACTN
MVLCVADADHTMCPAMVKGGVIGRREARGYLALVETPDAEVRRAHTVDG